MGAKYLCCLPLRLGVLVISFLQFITGLAVAGILVAATIVEANDKNHEVSPEIPTRTRIIMIILAVLHGLVALISLAGFIGAIRKKESYIGVFLTLIQVFFAIQVVGIIAYFGLYFVDRNDFKQKCIGNSTNQKVIDTCNSSRLRDLWVLIVSAVLPLLFSGYGVYIVAAYDKKLREQDRVVFNPDYTQVDEESHPLTHQPPVYPFTDNAGQKV
ncbi:hypothetical protein DFH08DRAFT_949994 [Mycena albidolilacea]|uniref:Uncharacterized protein n=1 Tax=Mycena albidolilacea TaxID=1033008 RepID=A0AAD7F3D1_9AGAR|nr:hypothetical protein DFH08DRAFT_949994 [Mycena albidolilacea]